MEVSSYWYWYYCSTSRDEEGKKKGDEDKRRRRYVKPKRQVKVTFSYYVSSRLNLILFKFVKKFIAKI